MSNWVGPLPGYGNQGITADGGICVSRPERQGRRLRRHDPGQAHQHRLRTQPDGIVDPTEVLARVDQQLAKGRTAMPCGIGRTAKRLAKWSTPSGWSGDFASRRCNRRPADSSSGDRRSHGPTLPVDMPGSSVRTDGDPHRERRLRNLLRRPIRVAGRRPAPRAVLLPPACGPGFTNWRRLSGPPGAGHRSIP